MWFFFKYLFNLEMVDYFKYKKGVFKIVHPRCLSSRHTYFYRRHDRYFMTEFVNYLFRVLKHQAMQPKVVTSLTFFSCIQSKLRVSGQYFFKRWCNSLHFDKLLLTKCCFRNLLLYYVKVVLTNIYIDCIYVYIIQCLNIKSASFSIFC